MTAAQIKNTYNCYNHEITLITKTNKLFISPNIVSLNIIAAEKNSTIIFSLPIDMMRQFMRKHWWDEKGGMKNKCNSLLNGDDKKCNIIM